MLGKTVENKCDIDIAVVAIFLGKTIKFLQIIFFHILTNRI